MRKLTVYGELYIKDEDFGGEWCADVELEDDQASNLIKLIMFACDTDVERICLKERYPDIYDILDLYNECLRSCGRPEVDKLDFEYEVNVPYEFQDLF